MPDAMARPEYRVRFGEPSDANALVQLINVAFRPEQVAVEGDRISAASLQPYFASGKFLVMEHGEGLAGCVYAEIRGNHGYIGLLALQPELKGRGLGRVLMSRAEEYLAGARCEGAEPTKMNARSDLVADDKPLGYL